LGKLYPNVSRDYISEIASVYLKFWIKSSALIPCGWMLNSNNSSYSYWNCVNSTTEGALKCAADFAIRITCGVSECGVERDFRYIKWLIGTKRFKLSSNTIKNLLYLKDCKLKDIKF
jgi:hypothetical protein